VAVLFINNAETSAPMVEATIDFADIRFTPGSGEVKIFDIWSGSNSTLHAPRHRDIVHLRLLLGPRLSLLSSLRLAAHHRGRLQQGVYRAVHNLVVSRGNGADVTVAIDLTPGVYRLHAFKHTIHFSRTSPRQFPQKLVGLIVSQHVHRTVEH